MRNLLRLKKIPHSTDRGAAVCAALLRPKSRVLAPLFAIACVAVLLSAFCGCDHVILLRASDCDVPGRRVPDGEVPTPADVALDVYCAKVVADRSAPNGYVTIFGSARAKEGQQSYDQTREFARLWTERYGKRHPILTGGGPGIMDAGNRGAHEAGGVGTEWEIYESLAKIQKHKKNPAPIVLLGRPAVWQSLFARTQDMARRGTISPLDTGMLRIAPTPADAVRIVAQSLYGENSDALQKSAALR